MGHANVKTTMGYILPILGIKENLRKYPSNLSNLNEGSQLDLKSRNEKDLSYKEKYILEKERNDRLENQLKVMIKMMEEIQKTNKRLERKMSIIEPTVTKHLRRNDQPEERDEDSTPKSSK